MLRRSLIALAAAGLLAAGCGDKQSVVTFAPDEGTYVQVGPLSYQVQISRYLNPGDIEDKAYLSGLPAGTQVDQKGQLWFGVFIRIKNYSKQTQIPPPSSGYVIDDTEGDQFHPVALNRKLNWYAYKPEDPAGRVDAEPADDRRHQPDRRRAAHLPAPRVGRAEPAARDAHLTGRQVGDDLPGSLVPTHGIYRHRY